MATRDGALTTGGMRRRRLCAWGVAASALPLPLIAQRRRKARLGVLTDMAWQDATLQRMFTRLAELGWSEFRNLAIDYHRIDTSGNAASLAATVRELVKAKCDLILTNSTPAALALKVTAPSTPMVFGIGGDPVALGLVVSLARPGGNATGWTVNSPEAGLKLISLLRELVPQLKAPAAMFEAGNVSMLQAFELMKAHAKGAGLTLRAFPLQDYKDVDAAEQAFMREPVDGLVVLNDVVTSAQREHIVALARRRRLPAAYGLRYSVDAGGLISYGVNWPAQSRARPTTSRAFSMARSRPNCPCNGPPSLSSWSICARRRRWASRFRNRSCCRPRR